MSLRYLNMKTDELCCNPRVNISPIRHGLNSWLALAQPTSTSSLWAQVILLIALFVSIADI